MCIESMKTISGMITKILHNIICKNAARLERNPVRSTNSNFLIPTSLQPDSVQLSNLRLFDPWFDLTEFIVRNIKGLQYWVAEI